VSLSTPPPPPPSGFMLVLRSPVTIEKIVPPSITFPFLQSFFSETEVNHLTRPKYSDVLFCIWKFSGCSHFLPHFFFFPSCAALSSVARFAAFLPFPRFSRALFSPAVLNHFSFGQNSSSLASPPFTTPSTFIPGSKRWSFFHLALSPTRLGHPFFSPTPSDKRFPDWRCASSP